MNQYFTNNENLKSNIKTIQFTIFDETYILYSDNGVFSKDGVDFGTRLLLETLLMNEMQGKVLDVGCGYGPIGLTIKKRTNCQVDMVDVNQRALHLTEKSAVKNNLIVNVYKSDAYENVEGIYDFIITNPPIRAGKKKVYEILIGAYGYLTDNGALWFVMRKDQGVKSTLKDLENYYNLSIKSRKKGFFVICATKKEKIVDNA
ncbi:MAG: methyltransferase [Bacilli bacterium]|nr:methyltransferase [Bacilli bacterium]MDD3304680.1 methyltransferase [Bacilli bacterium]MDD4053268.1 methyltransferase [Bacilli bacterium]MDD4411392.1 methyltransferase [Bacilli bacterium]